MTAAAAAVLLGDGNAPNAGEAAAGGPKLGGTAAPAANAGAEDAPKPDAEVAPNAGDAPNPEAAAWAAPKGMEGTAPKSGPLNAEAANARVAGRCCGDGKGLAPKTLPVACVGADDPKPRPPVDKAGAAAPNRFPVGPTDAVPNGLAAELVAGGVAPNDGAGDEAPNPKEPAAPKGALPVPAAVAVAVAGDDENPNDGCADVEGADKENGCSADDAGAAVSALLLPDAPKPNSAPVGTRPAPPPPPRWKPGKPDAGAVKVLGAGAGVLPGMPPNNGGTEVPVVPVVVPAAPAAVVPAVVGPEALNAEPTPKENPPAVPAAAAAAGAVVAAAPNENPPPAGVAAAPEPPNTEAPEPATPAGPPPPPAAPAVTSGAPNEKGAVVAMAAEEPGCRLLVAAAVDVAGAPAPPVAPKDSTGGADAAAARVVELPNGGPTSPAGTVCPDARAVLTPEEAAPGEIRLGIEWQCGTSGPQGCSISSHQPAAYCQARN